MQKPVIAFRAPTVSYEGHFDKPRIRLINVQSGTYDLLLDKMLQFGASLQGFKADVPQDLSRATISVSVLSPFGTAWLSGASLGLVLNGLPIPPDPDYFGGIVAELEAVAKEVDGSVAILEHVFTFFGHGDLEGSTPSEFISRYVAEPPEALGPLEYAGASYVVGAIGSRKRLQLFLEPSLSITPNGLFSRAILTIDAMQVPAKDAPAEALKHVKTVLLDPAFPLEIQWKQSLTQA